MGFVQLLRHGVTAGAAAGLSAGVVLWLVVEPLINRAVAIEDARGSHAGAHSMAEEPLVSRTTQAIGGAVTSVVVGVLVGLVFATVFARSRQRLPGGSDLGRAAVLAAIGFAVFALAPAVVLPANPPAVGDPDTVGLRSLLYVLTVLLGLICVGVVTGVSRLLQDRAVAAPLRAAAGTAVAVAGVVAVVTLVPGSPDTVPTDVPASLLWDFRVASLTQLAAMWLVLGLVFGVLADARTRARPGVTPASV